MSTPTSARETISVTQFTACPTASLCCSTGMYDWLCRLAVHRALEPADFEVMLRQVEMLLVARRAVEPEAVDRVALAAREGGGFRTLKSSYNAAAVFDRGVE